MERYLNLKNYKTKNYLKCNTMKLTPFDNSQDAYEREFQQNHDSLQEATSLVTKYANLMQEKKKGTYRDELEIKIKKIKQETLEHNRMLEEKMKIEKERGGSEYANYLVSMLNAGTGNYILE